MRLNPNPLALPFGRCRMHNYFPFLRPLILPVPMMPPASVGILIQYCNQWNLKCGKGYLASRENKRELEFGKAGLTSSWGERSLKFAEGHLPTGLNERSLNFSKRDLPPRGSSGNWMDSHRPG